MYFLSFFLFSLFSMQSMYYTGTVQLLVKKDPTETLQDYNKLEESIKNNPIVIEHSETKIDREGLNTYYSHERNALHEDLQFAISKKLLEETNYGIEGITALYRGYADISDTEGRLLLPRFDYIFDFPIIISERITPIFFNSTIPDHFAIPDEDEFQVYRAKGIEKHNDITNTKEIHWSVEKINQQENNEYKHIPQESIVILADPKNLFFSSEPMQMDESFNVILPTLFINNTTPESLLAYHNLSLQTFLYFKKLSAGSFSSTQEGSYHEAFRMN
jgi:hypothetical protein